MKTMLGTVRKYIKNLFHSINEGEVHGYQHAIRVYRHSLQALKEIHYTWKLTIEEYYAVLLASLLHDVDDEKFFPNNKNLENARFILNVIKFSNAKIVLEMIKLVSFSNNGISDVYISNGITDELVFHSNLRKKKSSIGTQHLIPKWKLIPRDSDRVEALGEIGVARCIAYSFQIGRLMSNPSSPRLITEHQIIIASIKGWLGNTPKSGDVIDYFIRGLMPRCISSTGLKYYTDIISLRKLPILSVIRIFGENNTITKDDILDIVKADADAVKIIEEYMTD